MLAVEKMEGVKLDNPNKRQIVKLKLNLYINLWRFLFIFIFVFNNKTKNMETLKEIKKLLLERRDLENANLEKEDYKRIGYFNVSGYVGGNVDDAFYLGKECGEANLIEELLGILKLTIK